MNPAKESITAHYNQYSREYDKKNKVTHQNIIDWLAFKKIRSYVYKKDVLEIGCGTGIWMKELQPVVRSIVGVDLSAGMAEQAKQKGLQAKVGDAELLPFKNDLFDTVYSYRVLPHVPDLPKAIAEMKRVLRKEGIAILMFYNKQSLKYLSRRKKMEERVFTSFYSISEIIALDQSIRFVGGYKILPYPKTMAKLPGVNFLYRQTEKIFSRTFLKKYGGNILFEIRK